jgi:dipeptidase
MRYLAFFTAIIFFLLSNTPVRACTNILVTRGASKDGSVMITYSCDGEFVPHPRIIPAADHAPGDSLSFRLGDKVVKIPQPAHTYKVVALMNEHQLVIGETTFSGREELINPQGLFHYWTLMRLALQRAKTAREAIQVITGLVEKYGYRSSGETFSIADPNEAWILEMIGPGPGGHGAEWVALRIPDGYISCHANKARIGTFPLNDPENCLYSKNVISFAIKKGYYDPKSGQPFRFNEAYCPDTPRNRRYSDMRVWSIFRRAAPSKHFSPAYARGDQSAQPYPLWIKPDRKLSVADVFSLMRDHYEGTPFDMTQGIDAGPYGTPNRWRPISWKVDSVEYAWERPISTQQTGFSYVSQSRAWLPDGIGGLLWYGLDDTYTSCYMPVYCSADKFAKPLQTGSLKKFSWDSAWWIFNLVANYANLKYSYMVKDIQKVQTELESAFLSAQPEVEKKALQWYGQNPDSMRSYLTAYSVNAQNKVFERWRELAAFLITKYNDGYVQDRPGHPTEKGYPKSWLRRVVKEKGAQLKLPENKKKKPESRLVD